MFDGVGGGVQQVRGTGSGVNLLFFFLFVFFSFFFFFFVFFWEGGGGGGEIISYGNKIMVWYWCNCKRSGAECESLHGLATRD